MTIGERLEEARKRKGISIREVAEATKIRGDYLLAMEDNTMEIDLPEIYRRGFLRNYAKFLGLEPDKILTDYEAQQRSRAHAQRERLNAESDRAVFGRMELPGEDPDGRTPEEGSPERGSSSKLRRKLASGIRFRRPQEGDEDAQDGPQPLAIGAFFAENTLYLKAAAGIMGALLVVVLIMLIVGILRSGSPAETNIATSGTTVVSQEPGEAAAGGDQASSSVTLRALEDVTVIVDSLVAQERLYQGRMRAGEVQLISKEDGPVLIKFSRGAALEIERPNQSTLRPSETGMGRVRIP